MSPSSPSSPHKFSSINLSSSSPSLVSYLFFFLSLSSPSLLQLSATTDNSHNQTCFHEHLSALLDLKRSFDFTMVSASNLSSWSASNRHNCCLWEGVACNAHNAHVIGLDLSGLFLSGVFDFHSLFRLRSLQQLDISLSDFRESPIPSGFYHLSSLTHLNLSYNNFVDEIPPDFSRLTRLVALDLSWNTGLSLKKLGMRGLLRNLSSLRQLSLDLVDLSNEGGDALYYAPPVLQKLSMSSCSLSGPILPPLYPLPVITHIDLSENSLFSPFPHFIANFTSLTQLHLLKCDLHGEFPRSIVNLPRIQTIDVSFNELLIGSFPEFSSNSSIKTLAMEHTGLYGMLPRSLGNRTSLNSLQLGNCNLSGPVPQSLGELNQLVLLDLSDNRLGGPIPESFLNLTQLVSVDLSDNGFSGPIPSAWFCLPSLRELDMSYNHFSGELGKFKNASSSLLNRVFLNDNNLQGRVPNSLFKNSKIKKLYLSMNNFSSIEFLNLSSSYLQSLDVHGNNFHGPIPKIIFKLTELRYVDLSLNNFSGVIDLGMLHNHQSLNSLDLSYNSFTAITDTREKSMPMSFPQLSALHLRSCNIKRFPSVLRNQVGMRNLDLSSNEIGGKIPQWIWKVMSNDGFFTGSLNLSHNAFHGIEGPLSLVSAFGLLHLDLSSNRLKGLIPMPPPSCKFFSIANNQLSGDVPSQICNATSLELMDLSNNNFSGQLPKCLGAMSHVLSILKLGGNNLGGTFLQEFNDTCNLRTISLRRNRVEGHLPESLANCKKLEVLDLANNQINGHFPVWLKDLPRLRVLVLRSNQFHGVLGYYPRVGDFPQLQIFDIAFNNFSGTLATDIFNGWKAMVVSNKSELLYLGNKTESGIFYEDTITVVGKGIEMKLEKILKAFTLVDLSNNKFEGSIPMSVGNLKSLHIINMSHNSFTGSIPASMGDIQELESLDLSDNELSGEIPRQLETIRWLAVLNLSQNSLEGPIPQGNQFKTFTNESFQGNLGLCGPPLFNMCEPIPPPPTTTKAEEESEYDWEVMWIAFGIGHGVGFGMLLWTLALWRQGRIAFFTFADRMLSFLFPPVAFYHLHHRRHPKNLSRKRNEKARIKD